MRTTRGGFGPAGTEESPAAIRQNVGRVDHVVYGYHSRSARDAARDQLTEALHIDDWDDVGVIEEAGLHVFISWTTGIELVAATSARNALAGHLSQHGDGFVHLVFGVADLDGAIERAESKGVTPIRSPRPPAAVFHRFDVARQAALGELAGVSVLLGELAPRPGHSPAAVHHVSFVFADSARRAAAVARFGAVLGIHDWEWTELAEAGVDAVVSCGAGIVLLAPTRADSFVARHLARHGDGFFDQVVRTDDSVQVLDQSGSVRAALGADDEAFSRSGPDEQQG